MRRHAAAVVLALAATSLATRADAGAAAGPFGRNFLGDWARTSKFATTRGSVLVIDALLAKERVAVFRRDKPFVDVSLAAEFRIERVGKAHQAFGLVFGSTDSQTYYAFEIGREEMRVVRVEPGKEPVALVARGIRDPAGRWATARLKLEGSLFRGYFGRQVLEFRSIPGLQAGWVGAYAHNGRVSVRDLRFGGKPSRLSKAWRIVTAEPDEK